MFLTVQQMVLQSKIQDEDTKLQISWYKVDINETYEIFGFVW